MHRTVVGFLAGALLWGAAPAVAVGLPVVIPATPVLVTAPTPAGVKAAVRPIMQDPALGAVSASVALVATGEELYRMKSDIPRIPGSTVKLATAAAALQTLGPNTRLRTEVRQSGEVLTLIGGGDATLVRAKGGNPMAGGSASLKDLAEQVAGALPPGSRVRVRYDTSAFQGPSLGPGWSRALVTSGNVAPVSALMINEGRVTRGSRSRVNDPAKFAAEQFADLLRQQGVRVRSVKQGEAPPESTAVASVSSPPISELVQRMLTDSLNDLAESLSHLVGGSALQDPSFTGGAQATMQVLRSLSVPMDDVRIVDGSGLSGQNRIPASTLTSLLTTVAQGRNPALAAIGAGLPIAGETGTLSERFTKRPTKKAAGMVRAKTGTLTGVTSLSGTVMDRDGHLMTFTIIANRIPSIPAARAAVDRFATALAMCGCVK